MESHIRGDEDMFALLEEMGGGGASASSPTTEKEDSLIDNTIKNTFTMPRTLTQAFQLSPPSNPEVEIIRHRNHEKFKSDFYDLFRNCVPSSAVAAATLSKASAKHQESPNAQRNQCIRSVLQPVWRQMPAHSIWERLQFSLKTLEAGCVRDNQKTMGQLPPWCCIESEEQLINHLLCPSVQQINAWVLHGKQRGIVWEPLLPVPAISSQDINDQTNQGYRRNTFSLIEEEVKFQFIRSFKKCIGGGSREALPSVDKVYSTMKSLPEIDTFSDMEEVKKDDVTGITNEKQAFILQNIFGSQPFKKIVQKLHKKMMYLAEDTYAHFLSDLKKTSDRKAAEEQQQLNKGRKRKGGKDKSGSMPKITFIDDDDDASTDRKKNDTDRQARVICGGLSMKINIDHMQKLERLHKRTLSNILGADESSSFARLLFTLLLRYDALEGAGLQSAIPHSVFRFLHNKFGCKFESFASPFNCYEMKQGGDSEYGTAFGDTDAWFGSEGSFFGVDFLRKGGCFQANPPFASEFMECMYQRMHHFLSMTNGDNDTVDEEVPPIQFAIFVPAWAESSGWQLLMSSPYLSKHCIIDQKKHYYTEGTQHRRSQRESNAKDDGKGSYRIASFDTSVFFLQNAAAKKKWPLDDEVQDGLEKAFALTEDEEEVKKSSVKSKKLSQKSAHRQVKKQTTTQQKKVIKQQQPEKKKRKKSSSAGKKKTLMSGGEDEMNIFNSLGLVDGDGNEGKQRKKSRSKKHR